VVGSQQPASATLLFYEGFAEGDYAEGVIDGQSFVGAGYAAGGAWNTTSTFETGGLGVPNLGMTDGFRLSRSNGEVVGTFDLTPTGSFGAAGLIGTNGLIGGTGFTGAIYFSILGNRNDTQDASFAGFNIYNGGDEGMGIGEVAGSDYSWLQGGSNGAIGTPGTPLAAGETRLFVIRLNYDAANPLTAQIWLDPDPLAAEVDQDVEISTIVNNAKPVDGFDSFKLRGTRIWEFDELRIGTTWEDVLPPLNSAPFMITEVSYDPADDLVTLTWNSKPNDTYTIKFSLDMTNWDADIEDGVAADPGDTTTVSFDLKLTPSIVDAEAVFFRVERNPG